MSHMEKEMTSILNTPILLGPGKAENRVVLQPMEGCDCAPDGAPGELTREKYLRAARSGAGTIWFEANAVCPEGRTNPRQMMLTRENAAAFSEFLKEIRREAKTFAGVDPVLILQLTHSGRQSIDPMIAYRNPIYEKTRPVTDQAIVTDEYLDSLPEKYVSSAILGREVGFDGLDVKSCHGYLMQELLSGFTRTGRYGGSFENRIKLYLACVREVKKAVDDGTIIASRLSVSDMVPKPYGFGTTEANELDLAEPVKLVARLIEEGVSVLNVTVGNPYYNPHVNRPYRRGFYEAPESAETGLRRFETIEKTLKERFKDLTVVASGLSYYRDDLFIQAERILREGIADMAGFGRMWLAYPGFYRDYRNGVFDPKKCCMSCSKCTELMRHHEVSGCAVFEPYYRNLYRETCLKK